MNKSFTGAILSLIIITAGIITAGIIPAYSLDYSVFGEITIDGLYQHYDWDGGYSFADQHPGWVNPEKENNLLGYVEGDLNHRILFDFGSIYCHHSLDLSTEPAIHHNLYEIYFAMDPLDWLSITIGRHRLNWGNGYIFTPTDTMHPANPDADPENWSLFGFTGASLIFYPTTDLAITASLALDDLFTTKEDTFWEEMKGALYVSYLIDIVDLYGSLVYQYEETFRPGAGISVDLFGVLISSEFSCELYNNAYYPEDSGTFPYVSFQKHDQYDPSFFGDFSIEKTFYIENFSVTLLGEYLFNGDGYSDEERDELFETLDYIETDEFSAIIEMSGEDPGSMFGEITYPSMLGRHYAAGSIGFAYLGWFTTDHTILLNCSDLSFQMNHSFTLTVMDTIDITLSSWWRWGEKETEFGMTSDDYAVELAVTYHF